ncbi:MAG: mycofactocin system glycosyltransferase [Rhodospirillales bacterium]|nr:MAG: mycofactocin system glycosyltransferase [Rhodospirillales bacterium]
MTAEAIALRLAPRQPAHALERPQPDRCFRYRLADGVDVIRRDGGGVLFSPRPLMAIRLNPLGADLVAAVSGSEARDLAEISARVPALSPPVAARFLDDLARRRLVVREPGVPALWPTVSIIVAAHGRPTATRACVQSLLVLDYPREQVEILVVDDASDPPLADALAGLPVRYMRLDHNSGQSAARNLAAAEAEGTLLAFTDNDCVSSPGWLRDLLAWFGDPDVAVVGGRVIAPAPNGRVAAFEAVRSPLDMGSTTGAVGPAEAIAYLPTCNLIVRRDAFLAVGGFSADMRVGEDVDFVWRLAQHGHRAHYASVEGITHDHRARLGELLRRRADYGASEADLQRRHPENGRVMHVPRVGLVGLAALVALPLAWTVSLALLLLAVALAVAEVVAKQRRARRVGLRVPLPDMTASMVREHAASLYHFGHDVTRYHGVLLAGLAMLWPPLLSAAAVLMLLPPICDHRRLNPALSLPTFIGLYWLEMAAYQVGVWRGCLARRHYRPLLPRIRWRS